MKVIRLSKGNEFALVDDLDYNYLMQWNWFLLTVKRKKKEYHYAICNLLTDKGWRVGRMHRMIMRTPIGQQVDHRDHNGLNCQRNNMRNCTHGQNQMNRETYSKSGYMGVYMNKWGNYFAQISSEKQIFRLGTFKTKELAALAYNEAAIKYHGEFAKLNEIYK
jgi:hypothetical protein